MLFSERIISHPFITLGVSGMFSSRRKANQVSVRNPNWILITPIKPTMMTLLYYCVSCHLQEMSFRRADYSALDVCNGPSAVDELERIVNSKARI